MSRVLICILGDVAGYFLFAIAAYIGIHAFSSNTHDRAVEAAMTAIFVAAPVGAIAGAVVCLLMFKSG
jgi:hypothetical protein